MGDLHLQIVHDIHQMEYRLAVGTNNNKVGIELFAVGQFAPHLTRDQIRNQDGLTAHFELNRAIVLVCKSARQERLDAALVDDFSLALKIGTTVTFARSGGLSACWPFIPIQPEPAQAVENDIDGLLSVSRDVGIFNSENKSAAGVPGVEPIEQGCACSADVQETSGAGSKANARFHVAAASVRAACASGVA